MSSETGSEIVGVVPAAGKATRLGALPCSKEVFPIGFHVSEEGSVGPPKVSCQYLLEEMRLAGVKKAYVVLREGKWDVAAYLKSGASVGMSLAYLVMPFSCGVPHTLDQAYSFVKGSKVVVGFPDTMVEPEGALSRLVARQTESGSDIVMGLFPAHDPRKVDMVELGKGGTIRAIKVKPFPTDLKYTWLIAVWTPVFTEYMHQYVLKRKESTCVEGGMDRLHLSEVIQGAITSGVKAEPVLFEHGTYLDMGTREDMLSAVRKAVTGQKAFVG